MSNTAILVGCDPEVILRDKSTGQFVSAHNLLPGTKDEPHKVGGPGGDFGAVQVDGVAAEFNINPAATATQFSTNIGLVMGSLQQIVGDKYELVSEPSVLFPEEYFKSLPENVRELGCNPDWNAYTGQVTDKPDGSATTMRTFAGHVHIGGFYNGDPTDDVHFSDCRIIARNLDYYLGLYSLQWDSDTKRRGLYGKAGCFRPKPYGIEYRPMSNVWLRTPQLQQWVFNAASKCIRDLLTTGNRVDEYFGDLARDFINNSEEWWTQEAASKSKDHRRLFDMMGSQTGLKAPPPIPKKNPVLDAKTVTSTSPKKYKSKAEIYKAHESGSLTLKEAQDAMLNYVVQVKLVG